MSVFISIIIFSIIVIIHELGHYVAARVNGIFVEEFAIGMGPKLFGFEKNGTLYSLRVFPVGGFCKMLGEDSGDTDPRAFGSKTIFQRFTVLFAGVFMNFILAFVVFTLLVMTGYLRQPEVKSVIKGSPAENAELAPGDQIIEINGTKINIYEDLAYILGESGGKEMKVTILRDGKKYQKLITPRKDESGQYLIGFEMSVKIGFFTKNDDFNAELDRAGFFESVANGFWRILFYIKVTLLGIIKLFTFSLSIDQMSGPIGIVDVIGKNYQTSITDGLLVAIKTMAQFVAVLSANLGVFNLLPLPALDGGRIIFLGIEAIRRKPVNPEREGFIHFVGFVMLMIFAVFIAYNDILNLFK